LTPYAADFFKLCSLPVVGGASFYSDTPEPVSIGLLAVWVIVWAVPYGIARYRAAFGPRHCEVAGLAAAAVAPAVAAVAPPVAAVAEIVAATEPAQEIQHRRADDARHVA
jgi:hypothetical protein